MEAQVKCDIAILGGGIIGLGTGLALLRRSPNLRVILLEKEKEIAAHQTGRNSGVIHSGVYYRPGSLKAKLCVEGARALIAFCREHRIRHELCGKLILATRPEEIPRLKELHGRAAANGVQGCSLLAPEQIREIEPSAAGIQGLHVPSTGIVDYREVARAYAQGIRQRGGTVQTGCRFLGIRKENGASLILTSQGEMRSRLVINCAGLQCDRVARLTGGSAPLRIIPFRGEYYELIPEKRSLVRGLIYPVPDPRFPFLGVHLSRRIDGRVEAGPSAVLALKREGYRKGDVSIGDCLEMLAFPGFWRMAGRHWKTGLYELARSFSKGIFLRDLRRLVPALQEGDLLPGGSGVRAQAVDSGGNLLDDFHLIEEGGMVHVLNAPSPAATASLAIGEFIAEKTAR
ncbi:MAG: L-2-hydroxyglutarate oxidase [Candidatus Omnitrophica bacterium]|nr:L-2-hydroxyglutarate oxidase [Candidatus Omnitrophota bacterium]